MMKTKPKYIDAIVMRDHDMTAQTKRYLELLPQSLNVDATEAERALAFDELNETIEDLNEKVETLTAHCEDCKDEVDNETQRADEAFDASETIAAENTALENYISYLHSCLEEHDIDYKEYEEYK